MASTICQSSCQHLQVSEMVATLALRPRVPPLFVACFVSFLLFAGAVFWHLSRFRTLNRRSLSTVKAATKVDESLMGIHSDNLDYWWAYCLVKDRTVVRYLVNDRSL